MAPCENHSVGMIIELYPAAGPALIVGGGAVAWRKACSLAAADFRIDVVAPVVRPELATLRDATVHEREFAASDVAGHALVFACTDRRDVNQRVGEVARAAGIPVVVADRGNEGTASTPAVHRSDGLTIAVSTSGASPRRAASVRDAIAERLATVLDG